MEVVGSLVVPLSRELASQGEQCVTRAEVTHRDRREDEVAACPWLSTEVKIPRLVGEDVNTRHAYMVEATGP